MGNKLIRYIFVNLIVKYVTPKIYKMRSNTLARPSILLMKETFNGTPVRGAEIGVESGKNAKSILNTLNVSKLYLVDPWVNYKGTMYRDQEANYKRTLNRFRGIDKVRTIKDFSKNAATFVEDDYLDFVYIDANHT